MAQNSRPESSFGCQIGRDKIPRLTVTTEDGKTRSLVRFTSKYFDPAGWTATRRCIEIGARFAQYSSQGELQVIVPGFKNSLNVLCAARSENEGCNDRILMTIKPEDDGIILEKVRKYNNFRFSATSKEVEESSLGRFLNDNKPSDFRDILYYAPVRNNGSGTGDAW